ncbi:MAG: aldo/keto reductase [Spirochaetaceae bacterium]|nr:aldo/keto reductase [Spirochaetaceae bacterium]
MQYRDYGKLGFKVSALGMGCMRLPMIIDGGNAEVDRKKAFEMIRYAADNGVNYFDTAYGYHRTMSESIVGEALEGERRKRVKIVTKQPLFAMPAQADIRKNLENTLKKLRTDYIDVYLIHNINPGASWEEVKRRNLIGEWEKFKSEGLIGAIGFSYHGNEQCFVDILDHYDWDMAQIQQNFMDIEAQATERAIKRCGKKGCACVIMEPLRGGGLATPPPSVKAIYDAYPVKRSAADWAFRHLLDYPEVSCILSGMSTLEQIKDNIRLFSADDAKPGCLSVADKDLLSRVRDHYTALRSIPCTGCRYCMPCPNNVDIPNTFSLYNDGASFENFDQPRRGYSFAVKAQTDASQCVECGQCEEKCPQKINVIETLKTAHKTLQGWVE